MYNTNIKTIDNIPYCTTNVYTSCYSIQMNKDKLGKIQEGLLDVYESINNYPIEFINNFDVKPLRDKLIRLVKLLEYS